MFGLDYITGRLESTLVGQKILTFGDLMYVMYIAITYMFRRKVVCDRKNRTDQAYVEQNRTDQAYVEEPHQFLKQQN